MYKYMYLSQYSVKNPVKFYNFYCDIQTYQFLINLHS